MDGIRMRKRGRPRVDEREKVVTVCVTVPGRLARAMQALADRKGETVSLITRRCYQRLAEFHHLENQMDLTR